MTSILNITLPFFALIGCGYLAGRLRLLPEPGVAGLNLFVFYFALPAMLFSAMARSPFDEILNWPFMVAWAAAGMAVFATVLGLTRVVCGAGLAESALLALTAEFPNSGYLGLPLITVLMGEPAAVPIALTIAVDLVLSLSLTLVLVEIGRRGGKAGGTWRTAATVIRAVALNPFILSILAGIAVSGLRLPMPTAFDRFTGLLSAAAGPGALFALGATLGVRPFEGGAGAVAMGVGAKLLLHPAAVSLTMVFLLDVPAYWAVAALLCAGIPSASNVYVLAQRYGIYVNEVSATILVSTALAVGSFILYSHLLGF